MKKSFALVILLILCVFTSVSFFHIRGYGSTSNFNNSSTFIQEDTPKVNYGDPAKIGSTAQFAVLGLSGTPTVLVSKILEEMLKEENENPTLFHEVDKEKDYYPKDLELLMGSTNQKIFDTVYQHTFNQDTLYPPYDMKNHQKTNLTPLSSLISSAPSFNTKFSRSSGFQMDLSTLTEEELKFIDKNISNIVEMKDKKSSWIINDPKLSLLLSLWRPHLPQLVCLFVYSPPISLLKSSLSLYPGLSATDILSLWENSTRASLNDCYNRPALIVSHQQLITDPMSVVRKLSEQIEILSSVPVRIPSEKKIQELCDKYSVPLIPNTDRDLHALSSVQQRIVEFFEFQFEPLVQSGAFFPHHLLTQEISSRNKREAYATLLTYSDEPYVAGALTLMQSINNFDTTRDKIVLILEGMPETLQNLFSKINCKVVQVEEIEEFYFDNSDFCLRSREQMSAQNKIKRWGKMFTKLRVWQFTQYSRIIYLDTDTIAFPSLPELFSTTEVMVAEGGKQHLGFNAGFMALEPSNVTFNHMMDTLKWQTKTKSYPKMFNNQVDCTEQAFLNDYFPLFKHVTIGRPDDLSPGNRPTPPLAHWITLSCFKPWSVTPCKVEKNCNQFLYTYWWQNFETLDKVLSSSGEETANFWEEFKKRNSLINTCPQV